MRYTLALVALVVGCATPPVISDAGPPLPPGWEVCPVECAPACMTAGTWCGDLPQCIACDPLCELPASDAGTPERLECDVSDFWCRGARVTGALPLGGRCFRFAL